MLFRLLCTASSSSSSSSSFLDMASLDCVHCLISVEGTLRAHCISVLLQHPPSGGALPPQSPALGPRCPGILPQVWVVMKGHLSKPTLASSSTGRRLSRTRCPARGRHVDVPGPSPGCVGRDNCLDMLQVADKVFLPLRHRSVSVSTSLPVVGIFLRAGGRGTVSGGDTIPGCFVVFLKIFWLHPGACGTLVPHQGSKPTPPALEVGVLITELIGDS